MNTCLKAMTSTKKCELRDISNKTSGSRLQTETNENLNLILAFFSTLKDNQSIIVGLEEKMESIQAECNEKVSALKNNLTQLEAKY